MSIYAKYSGSRTTIGTSSNYGRYAPGQTPPVPAFSDNYSLQLIRANTQYVTLGNNIRPQNTDAFSFSVWVYRTSGNSGGIISAQDSGEDQGFNVYMAGGVLRFEIRDATYGIFSYSTSDIPIGQWVHVVVTYDGSSNVSGLSQYFNGVKQTLTTAGSTLGTITYNAPTTIGYSAYGNSAFDGYMDELSIWNVALSQSQITALYNNGLPTNLTKAANLIHWYRMGDANDTSTTIYDQVGSVNGTVVNGAVIAGFAPFFIPVRINSLLLKNDPVPPVLNGSDLYIPYYQAQNPDTGYGAPDLEVYNNSSPTSPALIGSFTSVPANRDSPFFAAFGPNSSRYLYIVYYKNTTFLRVVDVLDPTNPVQVASLSDSVNLINGECIAFSSNGLYAYIIGSQNNLAVVDISAPTSPNLVTVINTGAATGNDYNGIATRGNYLYLGSDGNRSFKVYDISTPSAPSQISSISTSGGGSYVALGSNPNYVYLSTYNLNLLEVINVTNPAMPASVGTVPFTNAIYFQYFGNNFLYATADTAQAYNFGVFSVWNPSSPFQAWVGSLEDASNNFLYANGITIQGKYAYITCIYIPPGAGTGDTIGYLQIWQISP